MISGSNDKSLRVWDRAGSECLKALLHPEPVFSCALSATFAISGCGDHAIRFWDLRSGECLRIVKGTHSDGIYALQLTANTLVTGSFDKTACMCEFVDDDVDDDDEVKEDNNNNNKKKNKNRLLM